jgi:hypothetical protein
MMFRFIPNGFTRLSGHPSAWAVFVNRQEIAHQFRILRNLKIKLKGAKEGLVTFAFTCD